MTLAGDHSHTQMASTYQSLLCDLPEITVFKSVGPSFHMSDPILINCSVNEVLK